MKIGIFGGTFNPPHLGHYRAVLAAIAALGLDLLYVVPTKAPPHKALLHGTPNPEARYRMAELLFANDARIVVTDLELRRSGLSYTVDTAEAIRAMHPDAKLYLLLGTDMFLTLEQWHRPEELLQIVTPAVFARAEGQEEAIGQQADRLRARYGVETVLIDHVVFEVSSTELREALLRRQGAELVGDAVYGEIVRGRYYEVRHAPEWLMAQVALRNPKRVAHTAGTAEEAVRLAKYWGADVDQAREAAILHDITKGLDQAEQLRLCEKYGMMPDDLERENQKLLHAITGAGEARAVFGAGDAVFDAILYHTTGRADMTLLEKVIYLADYIEPNRAFPEVHRLRELAYMDLDAAVLYGLELTAQELSAKGRAIHPRSHEAVEWLYRR
ncbi:MAG: nicotinate (nicotinamide) nucleotide adenylyltransferase [Oscillospiraceae bacterium]|nr:nicotinate (nicotinamide) nucleotide adenylyltransferase [Oscillospiraceae bacterium]